MNAESNPRQAALDAIHNSSFASIAGQRYRLRLPSMGDGAVKHAGILLSAAIALLLTVSGAHARKMDTPSELLGSDWITVVSGVVGAGDQAERFELSGVETLRGRSPAAEQLQLRAPAWVLSRLVEGQRVIAAYQTVRRDPTLTDRRLLDPRGPVLLVADGLEPALFRDDALARKRLFDEQGRSRQPDLAEALAGLADPDPHWQNYYANDLALRPALRDAIDGAALAQVEAAMNDRDLHPSARAALFRVAPQLAAGRAGWWQDAANRVLAEMPLIQAADPSDTHADLARTVFGLFAATDSIPELTVAARWVGSSQPALVELALLAVRQREPQRELALVERALQRTMLPSATRDFLRDHQRRLQIMRDAMAQHAAVP